MFVGDGASADFIARSPLLRLPIDGFRSGVLPRTLPSRRVCGRSARGRGKATREDRTGCALGAMLIFALEAESKKEQGITRRTVPHAFFSRPPSRVAHLVWRVTIPHHSCSESDMRTSLRFRSSQTSVPQNDANFGIGALDQRISATPHRQSGVVHNLRTNDLGLWFGQRNELLIAGHGIKSRLLP